MKRIDTSFGGMKSASTCSSTLYCNSLTHNFNANAPSGVDERLDSVGYCCCTFLCTAANAVTSTSVINIPVASFASRERFFIPSSPATHQHALHRIDRSAHLRFQTHTRPGRTHR